MLILAVGLWLYLGASQARDGVGGYAFWSLMALLFFGWAATVFAPPDTHQLALGTLGLWLVVPWAWRAADAHREPVQDT